MVTDHRQTRYGTLAIGDNSGIADRAWITDEIVAFLPE